MPLFICLMKSLVTFVTIHVNMQHVLTSNLAKERLSDYYVLNNYLVITQFIPHGRQSAQSLHVTIYITL